MVDAVSAIWNFIASQESSVLSLDPDDHANWTSNIIGVGTLRGSKYGVSAANFPAEDIEHMTFDRAREVFDEHFFCNPRLNCNLLPPAVGVLLADAAWGSGPFAAAKNLQAAIGTTEDGSIGPVTCGAIAALIASNKVPKFSLPTNLDVLLSEFVAIRILYESEIGTWSKYKGGWVRRLTRSLTLARSLA